LEAQGTPYIPRPLMHTSVMLFNCQRAASKHTSPVSLPTTSKSDTKKGRPFLVAALS